MGRIRRFTDETYDALRNGVCSGEGFLDAVSDFFSDILLHVKDAFTESDLEDDMSKFQTYLTDISDANDYSEKEIRNIFREIDSVDSQYSALLEENQHLLNDYTTVIRKLKEAIGNPAFESSFCTEMFLKEIIEESQTLTALKWKEILAKNESEITDAEYLLIAQYLIQIGDEELLEDVLCSCYTYKNVISGQNGAGLTTTIVTYESNEKNPEASSEAIYCQLNVLTSRIASNTVTDEERIQVGRSIQFSQILQKIAMYGEIAYVSQTGLFTMTGDKQTRQLTENLIDITKNSDGTWNVIFCPSSENLQVEGQANYDYAEGGRINYTVSRVMTGQDGEDLLKNDSYRYINTYAGRGSLTGEMSEEAVNQLVSAGVQELFIQNPYVSAGLSILEAGAESFDSTLEQSIDIGYIGTVVDDFGLMIVSTDVNSEVKNYSYSLYKGETTDCVIESFNQYMQSEKGRAMARNIGYCDLPEGELTFDYIVSHPEDVCRMLNDMKDYDKDGAYEESFGRLNY